MRLLVCDLQDFTWQSYELCCGEGDVWGDGVIPLDCAIALEGAQHVILEGIHTNFDILSFMGAKIGCG